MKTMLTAVALAALVLPIQAKEKKKDDGRKGPRAERIMKKKDTDKDGFLSKDEFLAGAKKEKKAAKAFERIDKDDDGKISLEELKKRGKKHRAAKDSKKKRRNKARRH